MRVGVVTFPGTLDDHDAARAVKYAGGEPVSLWHGDTDLKDVAGVILPGGFSYGDYLRCGAIARFSNGFQVLCESHLLPGALTRNVGLHFLCRDQEIEIVNTQSAWSGDFTRGQRITIPLKNGEGSYQCDDKTLQELEENNQVIARYVGINPNGSRNAIAGITNKQGNVVGIMPHPEHAIDALTGPSAAGLAFFTSLVRARV